MPPPLFKKSKRRVLKTANLVNGESACTRKASPVFRLAQGPSFDALCSQMGENSTTLDTTLSQQALHPSHPTSTCTSFDAFLSRQGCEEWECIVCIPITRVIPLRPPIPHSHPPRQLIIMHGALLSSGFILAPTSPGRAAVRQAETGIRWFRIRVDRMKIERLRAFSSRRVNS